MVRRVKSLIKERVLKQLHIPYSRHGLPLPLLRFLSKGTPITLIDVGAHRGDFTEMVSKHADIGKAVLVEPITELAQHLQEKFKRHGYSIFNCVLSDKAGLVEFEINEAAATSSMLKIYRDIPELANVRLGNPKAIQSQARTLDEVACEAGVETVDLLKIDVQGAEHLVLRGGIETLKMTSLIWIEVSFKPLYEQASTFFEIYEMLGSSGFILNELEPVFRAPDGELLQSDALFVKKSAWTDVN